MTQHTGARCSRASATFNARIEENVGGMRVVQAFANEEHERRLFARDNARYRTTKLRCLPADGGEHVAELPQHAPDAAGGHGRRHLLRAARRADERAASSASCCWSASSSGRSRRSTPCWRPIRKASPGSGATPNCSTPRPTSPTRRMRSRCRRLRGDITLRERDASATAPHSRCCATST